MSPRYLQLPVSGRDRRHYRRELERVQQLQADLVRRCDEAYRLAHFLLCEEWNARQFIGGPEGPSPILAEAIEAGCPLLEVRCDRCGHKQMVDLELVIWPRDYEIHTLRKALRCGPCWDEGRGKSRPNLVELHMRPGQTRPPGF